MTTKITLVNEVKDLSDQDALNEVKYVVGRMSHDWEKGPVTYLRVNHTDEYLFKRVEGKGIIRRGCKTITIIIS